MEKQNMNDLIKLAKSGTTNKTIQKIVPVAEKEIKEIQFSFYLEKKLLKKLKMKAYAEETTMKQIVNAAIKAFLV